jgi:hypothetical protein
LRATSRMSFSRMTLQMQTTMRISCEDSKYAIESCLQ